MGSAVRAERSAYVFGLIARLVHRTSRDAEVALRTGGLNPTLFPLLLAIRAWPGASQQSFGTRFGVTRANVSMLVTRLAQAGLIRREPTGAANQVWLTESGEAVLQRLEPDRQEFMADRFGALSDAELEQLGDLVLAVLVGLPPPCSSSTVEAC